MDLMNFQEAQSLYFQEDLGTEVERLIALASGLGASWEAEAPLIRARSLVPDSYTVLVALYRYYYFTHRYADAFEIGDAAITRAARDLNWPGDWRLLTPAMLDQTGAAQVPTVRFLLFALKGTAYLALRLDNAAEARARLATLTAMDGDDVLGGRALEQFLPDAPAATLLTPDQPPLARSRPS